MNAVVVLVLLLVTECWSLLLHVGTVRGRASSSSSDMNMNMITSASASALLRQSMRTSRKGRGGVLRDCNGRWHMAMERDSQQQKQDTFSKKRLQSEQILDWAFTRATNTLEQTRCFSDTSSSDGCVNGDGSTREDKRQEDKRTYRNQPTVMPTALAHLLWKSALRPGVDSAIDATCGNGHDSLAIANILFDGVSSMSESDGGELLCVDIQEVAIERTKNLLDESFGHTSLIKEKHIKVIQTSHAPLPTHLLSSLDSVGLVCYNLGWLPGVPRKSDSDRTLVSTQVDTTLKSLVNAALVLRVGGLLSVMTYPGTCEIEADAVKTFCEALAMFTSREEGGWQRTVDSSSEDLRDDIMDAVQRVHEKGDPGQTWRVFDHRPLGRPLSPILVTAMRIK